MCGLWFPAWEDSLLSYVLDMQSAEKIGVVFSKIYKTGHCFALKKINAARLGPGVTTSRPTKTLKRG